MKSDARTPGQGTALTGRLEESLRSIASSAFSVTFGEEQSVQSVPVADIAGESIAEEVRIGQKGDGEARRV
jgi:hypothetical protein